MLPEERHEVCNLWKNTGSYISDHVILEYGHADVKITKVNSHVDRLFAGMGDEIPVFMSHYDKLVSLPTVSQLIAYF
jgi:GMP synthase (glutamine-hydrolysing)